MHSRISNVCHSDENFEWILLIRLADSALHISLDLRLSLLAVTEFAVRVVLPQTNK